MTATDATRFAGDPYNTRLAHTGANAAEDKTRLAQEGYKSRFARDVSSGQPEAGEFYKVGDKIGDRYEVSAIHHGELGVVYGCFDHQTKLPRALKTVRARHASDKQVLALFESEATVWISLEKHPYIVRAYLVERFESLPYVITEYVRGPEGMGGDLRGWLGHPRLTLPVAVAMALQIAQGMQHAVRKVPNLVHRDLKPANILVNGEAKAMVTDFGLVHAADSSSGTPAYMSPEQWRSESLDARSDIYAYGCILFEMLTAHRLFPALSEYDWESAHLESAPAGLSSIVPELPDEIDRFVQRCLEKDAAARPQSWDEIVAFFAEWYNRLTGKAIVMDFSSLARDAEEWLSASYSLSNLKRYEEMLSACNRALAIDPNMSAAWRNRGSALLNLKHYEDAIQAYDRSLAIDSDIAPVWSDKGLALAKLKRYEEAIQACDQALAIDQNDLMAWNNKGTALLDLKRNEEAILAYDRILGIDQNSLMAWNNLGLALGNLQRYDEALQATDRALTIDKNSALAWMNRGNRLRDLKRYEEAIQSFDRALEIDQNYAKAWTNKGSTLFDLKRYEQAIQAEGRALAIDPRNSAAWLTTGNSFHALNRYDEAIQAYDGAIRIDPNYFTAWYNKGGALNELKRYAEAIASYDRALTLDPNSARARNNRAVALRELNRQVESPSVPQSRSLWTRLWGK